MNSATNMTLLMLLIILWLVDEINADIHLDPMSALFGFQTYRLLLHFKAGFSLAEGFIGRPMP